MVSEIEKLNNYRIIGGINLYNVNLVDLEYEWVAEPGSCKKCAALNGKVYKSLDDVPPRPHPNCKCKLDVRSKVRTKSVASEAEAKKLVKKNEEQLDNELNKIKEDINSHLGSLKELLNKLNYEQDRLKTYQVLTAASLSDNDKNSIIKLKRIIQERINVIEKLIQNGRNFLSRISNNKPESIKWGKRIIDDFFVARASKYIVLWYGAGHSGLCNMPEAYELFKIAVKDKSSNSYIKNNGKLYKSIDDLNNKYDKRDIRERIAVESSISDCRVLVMDDKSSLSDKISKSYAIARFVRENYARLSNGQEIPSINITFENDDSDLYSCFHSAGIKNCKMDKDGNIRLQVVDFYNFNAGRTSVKGRVGRKLQDMGDIDPYYIIVDVVIPKDKIQGCF